MPHVTPKRILIVDDDFDHLEITKSRLEIVYPDSKIEVVRSGEECLGRLDEESYDCILSDYDMNPGMNGLQLLAELNRQGNDTPFIMLTNVASPFLEKEVIRNGGEDFITKGPGLSNLDKLTKSISRAVQKQTFQGNRLLKVKEQLSNAIELMHRYQNLFQRMLQPCLYINPENMSIVDVNDASSKIFGKENSELQGAPLTLYIAPEDRQQLRTLLLAILAEREHVKVSINFINAGGHKQPFQVSGLLVKETGKMIGVFIIATEI